MLAKRHFRTWTPCHGGRVFLFTGLTALSIGLASASDFYLDNGQIRLGVRTDSGACVDYLATSETAPNVINSFDRGRFVQQSYYGGADGAYWAGMPWSWNPVQGGSANGSPSTLLAFTYTQTNIYAKTMPRRWDTGGNAPAVTMEEWIELPGNYAHIHYRMTYTGADQPANDQELPAVFVDANLSTLMYYSGTAPWTNGKLERMAPPGRNAYTTINENWAAYVGPNNSGMGVYVPGTERMTFYRVPGRNAGPSGDGCSYLAPLRRMAITHDFVFDYDVYLTLGTTDEIRAVFNGIRLASGGG
jgi:hypothetical protein